MIQKYEEIRKAQTLTTSNGLHKEVGTATQNVQRQGRVATKN